MNQLKVHLANIFLINQKMHDRDLMVGDIPQVMESIKPIVQEMEYLQDNPSPEAEKIKKCCGKFAFAYKAFTECNDEQQLKTFLQAHRKFDSSLIALVLELFDE